MRKDVYREKTAKIPRLTTDKFFAVYNNTYKYFSFMYKTFQFIVDSQLIIITYSKNMNTTANEGGE